MTYVLDTNILLHITRANTSVTSQLETIDLYHFENKAFISIVSIGELLAIAQQNRWGIHKLQNLEAVVQTFNPIPINKRAIVNVYAEIDTFSKGKHLTKSLPMGTTARKMGKNDLWIAATAHLLNATLITTDNDFDHLKDAFIKLHKIVLN